MIRKYRSVDLKKVMEQIREDMGPDALILSTRCYRPDRFGLLGKEIVEVLAGPGGDPLLAKLPKPLIPPYQVLTEQGVRQDIVRGLLEELREKMDRTGIKGGKSLWALLARSMMDRMPGILKERPRRIVVLLGLSGVGKTTTALKLALREKEAGREAIIITLDAERIGGAELLKLYGKATGITVEVASSREELLKALLRHSHKDLMLIDTPGISYHHNGWLSGLRDVMSLNLRVEFHLLISVSMREGEVSRLLRRLKGLPLSALLFTKLDEASSFGTIFNQTVTTGLPLSYFTTGQRVPEDIERATKLRVVDLILKISEGREG